MTFARVDRLSRRRRGWVVVAALSIAASACAQDRATVLTPDDDRARDVAATQDIGRRGFLYEVIRPAKDGRPARRLFLYGTIHVGREGGDPFNRPLVAALRRSSRLALEADPTDAAKTATLALRLGQYGPGDRLDAHLPAALMARVRAYAERAGMPIERVETIRPWLLANTIVLAQAADAGLDPALGSEFFLAGYAHRARMPIVEIEGLATQLHWLADLPLPLQVAELDEALADVEPDAPASASDDPKELFDLWLRGDAAKGEALADTMHRDAADKVFASHFVATLIDRRNHEMAARAQAMLDLRGDTFFAVGSLHLFGSTGLLREFARRGDRVVDLQERPDRNPCVVPARR
jgi:hypothetical protein